jgi:hypothetical protein
MQLTWNPPALHTANKCEFLWKAPYSANIHQGYVRKDGSSAPARPFADITIAETNQVLLFYLAFQMAGSDLQQAFNLYCEAMRDEFALRIEQWRYEWDRATYRKIGGPSGKKKVDSPRDIIDTGNFVNSLVLTYRLSR